MAYFETINLVQGDTNPVLVFTLRDSKTAKDSSTLLDEDDSSTWKVFDITNYVFILKFKSEESYIIVGSPKVFKFIACITDVDTPISATFEKVINVFLIVV